MLHTKLNNGSIRRRNRNTVRDAARRAAMEVLENRQLLSTTTIVSGYGTSGAFAAGGYEYKQTSTWTAAENPNANDFGVTPYWDSTDGSGTNATDLYITQGESSQATGAWYDTPVPFQNFTATFDYQESYGEAPPADGFAFVLQNDPRSTSSGGLSTVVGGTGGSLGYSGITNSIGVQFNIYNGSKTGVGTNGTISDSTGTGAVVLAPQQGQYVGDVIHIQLIYNSTKQTLQEVLTDPSTKQTYSQIYTNINLGTTLTSSTTTPATTAFLGFTGGTGGNWAYQDITHFTFTTSTTPPPPAGAIIGFGSTVQGGQNPSSFTLNGANGQGIDGSATQDNNKGASPTISSDFNTLTLTTAATNQASSAFYGSQDIYQNFETQFTYTESGGTSPPANGFTFVLEDDSRGANALGGGGADLGYGTDASHPATAISPSIAIEFNNSNSTISLAENGTVIGTAQSTGSVNLGSGDPIAVKIDYNSSAIKVTLTDTKTNATTTTPIAFNNLNVPVILGNSLAWVGLTGGTGTGDSLQTISGFSFIPGNAPNPTALAAPATITGFSGTNTNGITLNAANGAGLNNSAPSNNNNGQAPAVSGDGNTLTLTTAGPQQASSAFFNTPVAVTNFTASFTYQFNGNGSTPPGQGFTFVMQNDQRGVNAIGGGAVDLGYGSDSNNPAAPVSGSFAAEFNLLNNSAGAESQQGFATNGGMNLPQDAFNNTGAINLASGHAIKVTLSYDAQRHYVYETLTDTTTKALYNVGYPINLNSQLGSAAFIGFTGGTASENYANQLITGFTFTTSANSPALPAIPTPTSSVSGFNTGWDYNTNNSAPGGVPGVANSNNTLTLTTTNNNEATTAFYDTPVTYGSWNASFTYQDASGGGADGFTFGMQDAPALGGGGGSKGYGGNAIPDTFAITFNIYNSGGTGIGDNSRVVQSSGTGSVDIRSTDKIDMSFAYDATAHTLTEKLVDESNSNTFSTTYTNVDMSRLLRGAPGAYLGFTGGTGGANANQYFSNFKFTSAANVPASPQAGLGVDFNGYGIDIAGQAPLSGGLDGTYALDSQFFTSNGGTSWSRQVTANGATQTFNFGTPAGAATGPINANSINANGQLLNLPQGKYGDLSFLGMAVNGAQNNQKFTVLYTDGSSATFTQSFSDWFSGTTAAGEQVAFTMNHRLDGSGNPNPSAQNANIHVYEYNFALDPTKTVSSVILPNNGNVKILAMNMIVPPSVSGVSPNSGPVGGGNTVTITGTGFSTATGVKFGSTAATTYTINSDTSITATVPAGTAAGAVDVTVTTLGGTSATGTADKYTYQAVLPTVTAVSPNNGPTSGGTTVTITGTGFTGATGVKFGTVAATGVTVVNDTTITAVDPAESAGTVDVTVTNSVGTSATSSADQFTYQNIQITVTNAVVNGDNPNGLYNASGQTTAGTQRSMVEDIVYTFSAPVTITNANAAFTVVGAGAHPGTAPTTLFAQAVPNTNGTQWAVSLTGQAEGTIASIANGEYTITVNPNAVFAASDGVTPIASGRTDNFYRLYGDIFGTRNVNNADYNLFKKSINTYNPAFDDFGTGTTSSNADYNVFKKDLNIDYSSDGFVTTI